MIITLEVVFLLVCLFIFCALRAWEDHVRVVNDKLSEEPLEVVIPPNSLRRTTR